MYYFKVYQMFNVFDYMLFQLCDVDEQLKNLKEMVIKKCRFVNMFFLRCCPLLVSITW